MVCGCGCGCSLTHTHMPSTHVHPYQQVHTGVTCESASEVYGHYYDSSAWSSDPWTTTYTSDASGAATIDNLVMDGFSVSGTYPVAGRAFVVHASDGTRVGCGVLEASSGAAVILDTYPGYSGR